jgi:hypothetical protein
MRVHKNAGRAWCATGILFYEFRPTLRSGPVREVRKIGYSTSLTLSALKVTFMSLYL